VNISGELASQIVRKNELVVSTLEIRHLPGATPHVARNLPIRHADNMLNRTIFGSMAAFSVLTWLGLTLIGRRRNEPSVADTASKPA
jgi:hypothetical protein